VSSLDRARDSIDLVAASVDASLGIVAHAIFGEDLVYRPCADALGRSHEDGRGRLRVSKVDML